MSDAAAVKVREIRTLIVRHKRWDIVFGIVGLLSLMIGVLTFVALFLDMLAAEQGSLLRVVVDGPLGERALGEIGELIERKFDED